ncbi:MAG TPA: isochorismatase family cysteine hydrolase [Acidimicrobiia bacterium]|jgi:maleamate amidohydrolase|nr:isochorismatase family cysteine hydrolase [Acidimicrobiia bacterium]
MSQTTALVLVDVLNGFFHPDGAMWYPEVGTVVEPLHRLLDTARGSDSLVIHVADRHRPGVRDAEFDLIPEHLGRGGHDAEYFAGFEPRPGPRELEVEKRRYSAFFATDLALILHEHRIETVVVGGVKTNVCIRATVTDGFQHGYRMVVPREATNSNRKHLEEASIEDMSRYIAQVLSLDAALELLE